ncbi:hypothetical protein [Haloechinothrix aidingensis]|uniref:hypothetical protein n=1 Tax=Haloechinothrix aidingensis TaxID=2752311 RepID=UPI001FE63644|nr:hypothetical protein [Haloechinothrix aidingensis]
MHAVDGTVVLDRQVIDEHREHKGGDPLSEGPYRDLRIDAGQGLGETLMYAGAKRDMPARIGAMDVEHARIRENIRVSVGDVV